MKNEDERELDELARLSEHIHKVLNGLFDEAAKDPAALKQIPTLSRIEIVAARIACELADRMNDFGLEPVDSVLVASRVVALADRAFKATLLDSLKQRRIDEVVKEMFGEDLSGKDESSP